MCDILQSVNEFDRRNAARSQSESARLLDRVAVLEVMLRYAYDCGYLKDKVTHDCTGLEARINAALKETQCL